MVKIVGKFLLCVIVSCATIFLNANVSMTVRSDNGASNQVVVGQPFIIDIAISDVYGSVQAPAIQGLKGFAHSLIGMYSSSINGKSTATYSYQVRIDALGSFVLGPAIVTHQQQQLTSNQVTINVVKDAGVGAQVQKNKSNQTNQNKAFLRLMVDEETVFVGQKMGCTIRFYYQDPSLSLHNIGIPEYAGFDKKEVGKLETGTAEIDGAEYHYAQWRWDMYPIKAGEFLIPAYNAEYDIPLKDNNLFGGLFMLMANRVDRKRVYSNAVTVKVLPLPHCNKTVHAVGSFERICATIKPGIAKEGEGMVLTIDVEGNGNLQAVALSPLEMPKKLKYYDSNSTVIAPQHADELPKKRFEFIVQGMECGECEIPEQIFTYFDVEKHAYVTLRTSPLAVSIMPGNIGVKRDITSPTPTTSSLATTQIAHSAAEDIAGIDTAGLWYPIEEREPLPWWLFQLLFILPLGYIALPFISEKCIALSGNSWRLVRRRAFKTAHKKIAYCMQQNDSAELHSIFTDLLQQLKGIVDLSAVQQNSEWNSFFERITYAAYAQSDDTETHELCRMAQVWLKRLEKSL